MQKLFNKILVPVDFSAQSKKAIDKAVVLAAEYSCSITLLHMVAITPLAAVAMAEGNIVLPYDTIDDTAELELELNRMAAASVHGYSKSIAIDYKVLRGSWNEGIIAYANDYAHDLILIGQKARIFGKRHVPFNPDRIANSTNVPVITVPTNKRVTKLYSILIPVTDFLPIRKLMYGIYMATATNATLKLLAVQNEKNKATSGHYVQRAYQLIKENCSIRTEIDTVEGNNTAAAVNRFAATHPADLIIVNPGAQTKMPGFFASLLGRYIQKYTTPPVMTVSPL